MQNTDQKKVGEIIWEASNERKSNSNMTKFSRLASEVTGKNLSDWKNLHDWSVSDQNSFWSLCSEFVEIRWSQKPSQAYRSSDESESPSALKSEMRSAKWFEGGRMNFAENSLPSPDGRPILTSILENNQRTVISGLQLWNQVASCAAGLKKNGIVKGDRVAGVLSNSSEAIVAMLATTSLGAIWSSCSPDFGVGGITDRLDQVKPKVVFFTLAYSYGGKTFDCVDTISECLEKLDSVEKIVTISTTACSQTVDSPEASAKLDRYNRDDWGKFLANFGYNSKSETAANIEFIPTDFSHPVYIMFSSGTTGIPKCIVHGAGGTILQHKKELILHTDVTPESKLFFFTTCGWMMWNWMVSTLSTGASLVTFDGSPGYPDLNILWEIIEAEKISIFGTSPKFLQACINAETDPAKNSDLSSLDTVLSTGAPLLPEHFNWVYQKVKSDVHLASISGGTDIISCFMLGNPVLPVRVGEIQAIGLGMAVEAWDEDAKPTIGEKAELVCTKPFVCMPVEFWNDENGEKYSSAYFDFYTDPVAWRHGDFIEMTENGGVIIHGRSDATLNPGGVRIGTSEIYRQVEKLSEIDDSIAIGRQIDGDVEIVLFIKTAAGISSDEALVKRIKSVVRSNLTPRHVPARIIEVQDIPYTRSGKKVEMAVTKVLGGETVSNMSAIANPNSILEYQKIYESLQSV